MGDMYKNSGNGAMPIKSQGKHIPVLEVQILRNMEDDKIYSIMKDFDTIFPDTKGVEAVDVIFTLNKMIEDGKLEKIEGEIGPHHIWQLKVKRRLM